MGKFITAALTLLLCLCYSKSFAMLSYPIPSQGNTIIGENLQIAAEPGDTLTKLGHRYNVSFHEMAEANPDLSLGRLKAGTSVTIPLQFLLPNVPWEGIVINLPELRLYYFDKANDTVYTYPIGIGRRGWRTPVTTAKVISKQEDPTWHVPESIYWHVLETKGIELPERVPPGPDNPLGQHAIRLSAAGYLIHGTNAPGSVGKRVSSGCIRMYPSDIEDLFFKVDKGTPVRIINHIHKAGWSDNQLFLESHRPLSDDMATDGHIPPTLEEAIIALGPQAQRRVDWSLANDIAEEKRGVPRYIGER